MTPTNELAPLSKARRARRCSSIGGISSLFLITGLLCLSGSASATPIVVAKPPYLGVISISNSSMSTGTTCRHYLNLTSGPAANTQTGWLTAGLEAGIWASSSSCGNGFLGASTESAFFGPGFSSTVSGLHNLVIKLKATWSANGTRNQSGKPGPHGSASVGINLYVNLFDNTSKGWEVGLAANQGRSWDLFHYTDSWKPGQKRPTWYYSGSGQNISLTFSARLTAGHQYLFSADLETFMQITGGYYSSNFSNLSGFVGNSVAIDLGSAHHGVKVVSMRVF